jgi:hypothetical protein
MNLAVIVGFCLIGLGSLSSAWSSPNVHGFAALRWVERPRAVTASALQSPQNQGSTTPSQPQAATAQGSGAAQPAPAPTGQKPNSPTQAKPSASPHRHHKKTVPSNCSNAPTPLNTTVGNPADATGTAPTDAGSANAGSTSAGSTSAGPAPLKPCPPPKKVVRNGGSEEPTVHLTGGTTAEQSANQRSTDQLTAATQENLKKMEGRQLSPSQLEMVSQIKQFMAQSKTAVAAGDLERGHDLALKAHLLSDELVKP